MPKMPRDPNEEHARFIQDARKQADTQRKLAESAFKARNEVEMAYFHEIHAIREDIHAIRLLLEKALMSSSESK
jgi:hypothetical protein